jgi:hypothetical protein
MEKERVMHREGVILRNGRREAERNEDGRIFAMTGDGMGRRKKLCWCCAQWLIMQNMSHSCRCHEEREREIRLKGFWLAGKIKDGYTIIPA